MNRDRDIRLGWGFGMRFDLEKGGGCGGGKTVF